MSPPKQNLSNLQIKRETGETFRCQQSTSNSNHLLVQRSQTVGSLTKRRKNNHKDHVMKNPNLHQAETKSNFDPRILQINCDSPQAIGTSTMNDVAERNNTLNPLAGQPLEQLEEDEDSSESEDFNYEPVLTKVLNEKKLALARSPEVLQFLGNRSPSNSMR